MTIVCKLMWSVKKKKKKKKKKVILFFKHDRAKSNNSFLCVVHVVTLQVVCIHHQHVDSDNQREDNQSLRVGRTREKRPSKKPAWFFR